MEAQEPEMIKFIIVILVVIVVSVPTLFVILGVKSRAGVAAGVHDNKLTPCPNTPNCVCSEFPEQAEHFIEPIALGKINAAQALPVLKRLIVDIGGTVKESGNPELDSVYLAATFTSSLFGFVDDLELRVDTAVNHIQLRSASRVGRSDLGANRKRVQALKSLFEQYRKQAA